MQDFSTPTKRRLIDFDLPQATYPFCMVESGGFTKLVRLPKHLAIKHERLQLNASNSIAAIILDCDNDCWITESARRRSAGLPVPSWSVHTASQRAHICFVLSQPVHKNETSSIKAMRFLAAVYEYLRTCYNADPGYTQLICRNPEFEGPGLRTLWEADHNRRTRKRRRTVHTLHELAQGMDSTKPAILTNNPIGRNVTLFESLMRIAGAPGNRTVELLPVAMELNDQFETPLLFGEVKATAKSVTGYRTRWNYYDHSPELQAKRGRKSGQVRAAAVADRNSKIVAFSQVGMHLSDLARSFGLSTRHIRRILAESGKCDMNLHR